MKIGIPKEIKDHEFRVSITPSGVQEFVANGHEVYIEHNAGLGSGFPDEIYVSVGAKILQTAKEVYDIADMIYKVKEPIGPEYEMIHEGQIVFTYFHFACEKELTEAMIKRKAICIAFETVRGPDGRSLPLLVPMSQVAGRMSAQEGARFLERPQGGKGILLSGVPGVKPANVLVLGAGTVGYFAALSLAGMGAQVTITDVSIPRLNQIRDYLPSNVSTLYSTRFNIEQELLHVDLIIGCALIPGSKAPYLITKDMLKLIRDGTVMIDVAIDQGGCFESSHPTTHTDPTFIYEGKVHYCVGNIPGAVPFTSTPALANATFPYALQIANLGWEAACRADKGLAQGLNIVNGKVTFKGVADAFNLPFEPWA
ncbi:Alanine dehydrogenase 2, putative [Trichomonas vaginalis G3]|uniref:alanine dehydrogenase n=1 Tax=Trichomonas vaginalis (strain ATCC PRA-98 / G3) TaxID=412133 RepID=A2E4I0_TRIV3|nr:alanine dehydrogenase family [Trichomonas vaginalis G3]EAY12402.1 Alanine dehydrogenase 2, putative [Trichomonas vaginalis G3]KAI5494165.1 alanine dehydrogenase family [Trichomonas vaginalis G3]|eukprot:XP_001324625.1 Alanine dehydrogenase 2 [Trichomonas vaginalis G3]